MTSENPPEAGDPSNEPTALVDATFAALADAQRRHALYYLRDRESATLDELATVLTGWLSACESEMRVATPTDRDRVRIGLHHGHLPYLATAGFVRYDADSGEVGLADLPEFVEVAIDRSLATDRGRVSKRGRRDASNHGYT